MVFPNPSANRSNAHRDCIGQEHYTAEEQILNLRLRIPSLDWYLAFKSLCYFLLVSLISFLSISNTLLIDFLFEVIAIHDVLHGWGVHLLTHHPLEPAQQDNQYENHQEWIHLGRIWGLIIFIGMISPWSWRVSQKCIVGLSSVFIV